MANETGKSGKSRADWQYRPMTDQGMEDHLEIIRLILELPDDPFSADDIRSLVETPDEKRTNSVNRSLHHLCKMAPSLDTITSHRGHASRLEDAPEFRQMRNEGVLYRVSAGLFVYDTGAHWEPVRQRNKDGHYKQKLKLVNNAWSHTPYSGASKVYVEHTQPPSPAAVAKVEEILHQIDDEGEFIPEPTPVPEVIIQPDVVVEPDPEPEPVVDPEPEAPQVSEPRLEVLSIPDEVRHQSELVLRVDGMIAIVTVNKLFPLAAQ